MVLPDTNIWADYLRRGQRGQSWALDGLLEAGEVLVCGPVVAELLVRTPANRRAELWQMLSGLPWADVGRDQWRRVGEIGASVRERGATVALTDLEIAVAAVEAGAALWTRDSDFEPIAAILPTLRFFTPPPAGAGINL